MTLTTRDEWEALPANEQFTLMHSLDTLVDGYQRVMREIPGCEAHGDLCTYHAIQWIREVRAALTIIEKAHAILQDAERANLELAWHEKPADTSFGTVP